MNIQETLKSYNTKDLTIGVLGGHSALDVCQGAKKHGFKTLAVCQKGREKTYNKYFKSRDSKGCIDEVILVDSFGDVVNEDVQEDLRKRNTIFIHNRYFWVYCDFKKIESEFNVPIYGTREMLKLEERDVEKNQYYLLQEAGIRIPRIFEHAENIDRLVIVKVNEAHREYERAFFLASSFEDYKGRAEDLIKNKTITQDGLDKAIIEEYMMGAHINLNFFYSNIEGELELMGTDTRRQTNLDGLLRLPATEQLNVLSHVQPKFIETGHYSVTAKESLLEKMFEIGEKFVDLSQKEIPPGIIGPFALQGAVSADEGKEEFVIFDVSMRIPGSPGTKYTPYSGYLHGNSISYGERIAMELKKAIELGRLHEIVT